ncbi:2Fe-2S iron-sulfur cluster-binding protein [Allocoprobacillus halotolerans]|uniref:2Fe-2S iron-sulfur cluster-binding protein n=1 Tax=Allocoprobacillus halotolerans TaxID=2944914 RepID=A0ABY5HYW6_9FIRM|nr:2Fe-2S iron-sulfur cluster-binding protein [Allocoprobacillus halotolerans]UTY38288.1 2Fe-2S iron-sulfur cluster-binding protein [Allocoprobacillus halotolerans]
MSKIKITINNREVEAYEGQTILEAAKNNGIHIPTLCYFKDITGAGACRVCQVEVEVPKHYVLLVFIPLEQAW